MAIYDPPQPLWKRNLAGILDFVFAAWVFGFLLYKIAGTSAAVTNSVGSVQMFTLGPWSMAILIALITAYFVVLGRTGGTLFQRLFRMKRAK
jgi:hypothetical protein